MALCCLLTVGVLTSSSGVALGAPYVASTKTVSLTVKTNEQGIGVTVPAGCTSCVIDVRPKGSTRWMRWSTLSLNGLPRVVNLTVSRSFQAAEWRATGTVNLDVASAFSKRSPFPESFYQGTRTFTASPAMGYQFPQSGVTGSGTLRLSTGVLTTSGLLSQTTPTKVSDSTTGKVPDAQAVEADIWKTEGSFIYFFNQLRGLQVLDISEPSNPVLSASLRMPAVGQDMYLLPDSSEPGVRYVLLLVRDTDSWNTANAVVVRVNGRVVEEVSRTVLKGGLSDSRMVGSRLYVVTTDWSNAFVSSSGAGASNTVLTEIVVGDGGGQSVVSTHPISGASYASVISAGGDWLAISSASWTNWNQSNINLFQLSESGAVLINTTPVITQGSINDKFKVSYANGVLTTVSQKYETASGWTPVSVLESFDASGKRLASLEIMRGEQLYATRFAGDKLYVVTFRQTDPLWIIDLSDRTAPSIKGHVEVPGYSTYMEPLGEDGQFLFTIGLESGKVAASLFDVSDPSLPALKSRVYVDEGQWGYSEAVYDEKALKVLAADGLALIPFSAYRWYGSRPSSEKTSFLRLIDISLIDGGSLTLRGHLEHEFAPRRATLVDGVLASISQKELITANVEDRDHPKVLADVALAWPVNQVIQSGDYLLQISDGSSVVWSGDRAAIRISKVTSTGSILNDIDMAEGTIQDAVLRNSKLYVLRRNWNPTTGMYPFVRFSRSSIPVSTSITAEFALDVYDASQLPSLPLVGTVSVNTGTTDTNREISRLLWLSDTLTAVITQTKPTPPYWRGGLIAYDSVLPVTSSSSSSSSLSKSVSIGTIPPVTPAASTLRPAVVYPIDVSVPTAPVALRSYSLAPTTSTVFSTAAAGDGLLVFGYGQSPENWSNARWPKEKELPKKFTHRLGVLDFANPKAPMLRVPVTLPGRLIALSEISRKGFLAFSEKVVDSTGTPTREVQVSLVDELQASLFASMPVGLDAVLAADGRSLIVADGVSLRKLTLNESANFEQVGGTATLPWAATELQTRGLTVLGIGNNQGSLFRVSWPGLDAVLETWKLRQWSSLPKISIGSNRNLYVPEGDYGVGVFEAQ